MKAIRILSFTAALAVALPLAADDKGGNPLVGTYTVVKGERDGKPIDEGKFKGSVVTFTDKRIYGTDKDRKEFFSADYKLDRGTTPWTIHMESKSPREQKSDGVIAAEGDTLRVAYALPGGKAPSEFKAGENQHYFVLKRIKSPR